LASVKVLSVPDGGGFVVDSVNDNDGEDSDWKKYSSYEHCSPDHREQFTLALVVCVLLALCSAFALIITINRSGSMEDRAKKGHATEADQQNTCNVDVANKSSVSSISSYILLKRLCIGRDRRSAAKTSMKFSQGKLVKPMNINY
jgi:hypothetical protein